MNKKSTTMNEQEISNQAKFIYKLLDEAFEEGGLPPEARSTAHDNVTEYLKRIAYKAKDAGELIDVSKELWQALAREQILLYYLNQHLDAIFGFSLKTPDHLTIQHFIQASRSRGSKRLQYNHTVIQ